jgi:2-methylcitrate dehydratase PrpD
MGKECIARSLAKYVDSISYEKLPGRVTHRAKNLILDALGTAIGGREMPRSRIALEIVRKFSYLPYTTYFSRCHNSRNNAVYYLLLPPS